MDNKQTHQSMLVPFGEKRGIILGYQNARNMQKDRSRTSGLRKKYALTGGRWNARAMSERQEIKTKFREIQERALSAGCVGNGQRNRAEASYWLISLK
jgi:hypothetical protein